MNKITRALGTALAVPLLFIGTPAARTHATVRPIEVNILYPGSSYNIQSLTSFQNSLGVPFTSAKWYEDWSQDFDTSVANRFHNAGYIPELTWQPQVNGVGVPNIQVTGGAYDSYINQVAQSVKTLNYTVRISLAPEMNGDWATWGVTAAGNNNETHKAFYQYVVQKFRNLGVSNVQWIWAPNVHTYGEIYSFAQIFPGDAYVDFVGLDGYNWGISQSWSTWQSFATVYDSSYRDLVAISRKPILIMEMASAEAGGNKANWILDMFSKIRISYPRIQGFTWFNENKETDWRIESSTASRNAFIAGYFATESATPTPTPTTTTSTPGPAGRTNPTSTPKATGTKTPSTLSPTASATATPSADAALYSTVMALPSTAALNTPASSFYADTTLSAASPTKGFYERHAADIFADNAEGAAARKHNILSTILIASLILSALAAALGFTIFERRKAALKATPIFNYDREDISLYENSLNDETLPGSSDGEASNQG